MLKILHLITFGIFYNISYASNNLEFVKNFDYTKYAGIWYEIARLPVSFEDKCQYPITANYEWDEGNKYLKVRNKCVEKDGSLNVANGRAYFVEDLNTAKLEVSFLPRFLNWIPMTKGDYWVIKTDYVTYSLVGSPNRKYFWILSRKESLDRSLLIQLLEVAKNNGYNIKLLKYNDEK
jgi:apolipoprotein D and lipocalin family protein